MPTATPTPRAESTRRRESLLAAALEAFNERGYGATSMSDIRRATGASTGSLYHHFPSKQHLAAELYVAGYADYQRGVRGVLERARTARAGIRGVVEFHLRWIDDNPELTRFLHADQGRDVVEAARDRIEPMTREFFADVRAWLHAYAHRGEVRMLPDDLYHAIWSGPAHEVSRQWLAGRVRTPLPRAARVLADTAWEALRGETG